MWQTIKCIWDNGVVCGYKFRIIIKEKFVVVVEQGILQINVVPWAAATAVILATSTAAEDDTPLPSGTPELTCVNS